MHVCKMFTHCIGLHETEPNLEVRRCYLPIDRVAQMRLDNPRSLLTQTDCMRKAVDWQAGADGTSCSSAPHENHRVQRGRQELPVPVFVRGRECILVWLLQLVPSAPAYQSTAFSGFHLHGPNPREYALSCHVPFGIRARRPSVTPIQERDPLRIERKNQVADSFVVSGPTARHHDAKPQYYQKVKCFKDDSLGFG